MTYEQAKEYKLEHEPNVILKYYTGSPSFRIQYLLIAPKELSHQERVYILERCFTILDNELVLEREGLMSKDLDLYIMGDKGDDNYFEELLSASFPLISSNKKDL